jgi:hypothetical protein
MSNGIALKRREKWARVWHRRHVGVKIVVDLLFHRRVGEPDFEEEITVKVLDFPPKISLHENAVDAYWEVEIIGGPLDGSRDYSIDGIGYEFDGRKSGHLDWIRILDEKLEKVRKEDLQKFETRENIRDQ